MQLKYDMTDELQNQRGRNSLARGNGERADGEKLEHHECAAFGGEKSSAVRGWGSSRASRETHESETEGLSDTGTGRYLVREGEGRNTNFFAEDGRRMCYTLAQSACEGPHHTA